MSEKYWREEDKKALHAARSYGELFEVARCVMERMPRPRGQMCGPISTGGAGSIEANLKRFEIAYEHALKHGVEIFDQTPFERHIHRIQENSDEANTYSMGILEEFYLPIFENRLVDKLFFLPDWQTSRGASWEHEQVKRLGLEIVYLPEDMF